MLKVCYAPLIIALFIFSACGLSRQEELFLENYTQQFTQQIAASREEMAKNTISIAKIIRYPSNKSALKRDSMDYNLKRFPIVAKEYMESIKSRKTTDFILKKMDTVLSAWNDIQKFYPLPSLVKVQTDSVFRGEMAKFSQVLSAAEQKNDNFSWNLAEMSANNLLLLFSRYTLDNVLSPTRGLFDPPITMEIYTEKPIRINQETDLHFIFISYLNEWMRFQIAVNQQLVSDKSCISYEFIPQTAGTQTIDISAQVYKKNGDTVFLSKKIEIEVSE